MIDAESLSGAVQLAAQAAHQGDAVILSPACASFDMFRDYRHRADVYGDAVRELAAEAGQPC
jgi:UDP-N-acetylmuramoylalanine--D-glutamate ligase